uniref:Uncharacterized protein n=1 Tax=Anguilla anguilla TaxID=7936 RepID=A0A0E9PKX4_ANGAN
MYEEMSKINVCTKRVILNKAVYAWVNAAATVSYSIISGKVKYFPVEMSRFAKIVCVMKL